jgi:hypothetical protein
MEENMEIIGAASRPCLKIGLYNVLSNVTYLPCHHQASTPIINIISTLRTTLDSSKNVSLTVLFDSNGNSCTISKQSDILHKI